MPYPKLHWVFYFGARVKKGFVRPQQKFELRSQRSQSFYVLLFTVPASSFLTNYLRRKSKFHLTNLAFGGLFYSIPERYLRQKIQNFSALVFAAKELTLHSGDFVAPANSTSQKISACGTIDSMRSGGTRSRAVLLHILVQKSRFWGLDLLYPGAVSTYIPPRPLAGKAVNMVVPSFKTIAALVSLFAFFAHDTLAQTPVTAVTLWQFGQGRLLEGQTTLPLQPLGTARDGSATTYLYEVLNKAVVNTVVDGSFTTQTIASPATRTIIASASGWVEPFGTAGAIACGFIGPNLGECFIGTTPVPANTGTPFAQVLQVAAASPTFTPSVSPPAQTSTSTSPAKQPPAGAIAGGVIGGVVIFMGLALCIVLLLRRRRLENITAAQGYVEHKSSDISSDTSGAPFAVGPQLERGMGAPGRKGDTSDLPTADWVTQRVQNNADGGQDAPPEYPGRSPKR
ncbi:hypothetical protein B0H13DRAFT_1911979 [Mycena leptocephala]|nr:hypothetical protein B0H13DRAFT_1911979 [Mycena leptocephala]